MEKHTFYLLQEKLNFGDNKGKWKFCADSTIRDLNNLDFTQKHHADIWKNKLEEIAEFDIYHHGHKIRDLRWAKVEVKVTPV
jgi:hypothetical protein